MSMVNEQNYEAYYLDYLEGNLAPEATAQLWLFLDQHPALKAELDDFRLVKLSPDPAITFDKDALRQNIDERHVEDYLIASLEKELDAEDAEVLARYLETSPEAKTLAERYQKTILPRPVIPYPHKDKLKKKATVIYYLAPLVSAAAVWLFFLMVSDPSATETPQGAQLSGTVGSRKEAPALAVKESLSATEKTTGSKKHLVQYLKKEMATQETGKEDTTRLLTEKAPDETTEERPLTTEEHLVKDTYTGEQEDEHVAHVPEHRVDVPTTKVQEELTLKRWAAGILRKKVLNHQATDGGSMAGNQLVAVVVEKIDEHTHTDIEYQYKEEMDRASYNLTIGRFQLSGTRTR